MVKHLTVLLRNTPGEFLSVMQRLKDHGVRTHAFHLASTGPKSGYVQLVCDDHNKALTALAAQFHLYVQESEVMLLRLHADPSDIISLLSEFAEQGINIENAYQTLDDAGHTLVVLEAGDDDQLARACLVAREHLGIELVSEF